MDGSSGSSIILIFVLVMVNAFFASAEMAIVSINKTKIGFLADEGNKKAQLLLKLINEPSNFLATIQVGITFAGFFASASAATSISSSFAEVLDKWNIPYSEDIALVLITILISYITLVLGELLPKRIALQNAERVAMISVKPIVFLSKLARPFVWFLSLSTNILLKLFGVNTSGIEEKVSREEIKSLINLGEEQGAINETERDMIEGIIKFDDVLAKEIMTPRTETFCIELNSNIESNIDNILYQNYSRIPVYEEDIDNIVGILYMKDLFSYIIKKGIKNISIKDIMRKPYLVPETKKIDKLLRELQNSKNYIAILIDEYGGFSGVVTLEDLVEEVVGEIVDEYDDDFNGIKKIDDKTYILNGLLSISDVNKYLDLEMESESDFIDTIGGLVLEKLGDLPKNGEVSEITLDTLKLKVLALDDKRIDKIQLTIL